MLFASGHKTLKSKDTAAIIDEKENHDLLVRTTIEWNNGMSAPKTTILRDVK